MTAETTESDELPAKVRIGFIGTGGMARHHMGQLLKIPGVGITALCDTAPISLEKTAERYPTLADVFMTADYLELLQRGDVDAVIIATPHTLHFEHAVAALESGKNVLLEKPMVSKVTEAHELLAKLQDFPKVFALAYQRHVQGEFIYMHDKIASGELGAVTFINALQCQQWKKGTAGTWRQDPALGGGGQINDSGSHLLDILLWMTGLTVAEVSAYMDNRGTPVDINSALAFRFTSGAQGTISVVGDATVWHEDITIWCEKGAFFYRNGALEFADADGKRTKIEGDFLTPTQNIDEHFVACVRGESVPAAPPLCGLRTIELTEAAWRSAAQGGAVVKMN